MGENSVPDNTRAKKRKVGGTCCTDGLCSKRNGRDESSIPGRPFLRFFRFPKDPVMRSKWSAGLGRDLRYFTPTDESRICSDHFRDEDIEPRSVQRFLENDDPAKKTCIKLLTDSIPNTVRLTGHRKLYNRSDLMTRRVSSVHRGLV